MSIERLSDNQLIRRGPNPIVKMSKQQKLDWTGSINIRQSSVGVRRADQEFLTLIAFVIMFVCLFDFVFFFTNQHLAQNRDGLRWSKISFSHSESLSLCLYFCLYFVFVFGISLCLCRQQPIKSTFQPGEKRANGDRAESFFLHSESLYLCFFLFACVSVFVFVFQPTNIWQRKRRADWDRAESFFLTFSSGRGLSWQRGRGSTVSCGRKTCL